MVPAGNKAKRLSLVNHTTKTIHYRHDIDNNANNTNDDQITNLDNSHKLTINTTKEV